MFCLNKILATVFNASAVFKLARAEPRKTKVDRLFVSFRSFFSHIARVSEQELLLKVKMIKFNMPSAPDLQSFVTRASSGTDASIWITVTKDYATRIRDEGALDLRICVNGIVLLFRR